MHGARTGGGGSLGDPAGSWPCRDTTVCTSLAKPKEARGRGEEGVSLVITTCMAGHI